MALKRWLAVRRWRFLWAALILAALRIAGAALLRFTGPESLLPPTALIAWDVAIGALAVAAAIAFVQYGRIYRARIPTE